MDILGLITTWSLIITFALVLATENNKGDRNV